MVRAFLNIAKWAILFHKNGWFVQLDILVLLSIYYFLISSSTYMEVVLEYIDFNHEKQFKLMDRL